VKVSNVSWIPHIQSPTEAVFASDGPEDATAVVARYLLYVLCCTVTKLPFLFCPSSLTAASLSFLRSIMRKSPIIIILII
jgi:ABC-type microcin C transport system permease subunit YejE